MDRDDLVKKVMAMLDQGKRVYDRLKSIATPEKLSKFLDLLDLGSERSLSFLQGAKAEGIFEEHFKIKGMEELWRDWARKQGVKEGHFLFEN